MITHLTGFETRWPSTCFLNNVSILSFCIHPSILSSFSPKHLLSTSVSDKQHSRHRWIDDKQTLGLYEAKSIDLKSFLLTCSKTHLEKGHYWNFWKRKSARTSFTELEECHQSSAVVIHLQGLWLCHILLFSKNWIWGSYSFSLVSITSDRSVWMGIDQMRPREARETFQSPAPAGTTNAQEIGEIRQRQTITWHMDSRETVKNELGLIEGYKSEWRNGLVNKKLSKGNKRQSAFRATRGQVARQRDLSWR